MGDANGTAHILVATVFGQVVHLALCLIHIQFTIGIEQRHTSAIIAAIFQSAETLDEDGIGILLTDISYDSTHGYSVFVSFKMINLAAKLRNFHKTAKEIKDFLLREIIDTKKSLSIVRGSSYAVRAVT
jgi:hypothetical protein